MIRLICKDVLFNKTHVLAAFAFSLISCVLLAWEEADFSLMAFYLSGMLIFNFVVGRACSTDEQGTTLGYLKALPIESRAIVSGKFVSAIGCIALVLLVFSVGNSIIRVLGKEVHHIDLNWLAVLVGIELVYMGAFLFIYFKYGYAAAQYTIYVVLVGLFLLKVLLGRYPRILQDYPSGSIGSAVLAIGVVSLALAWRLSIKAFERNER
ncbi:MAG TPA: hypothetical protein DCL63_02605 [Firmicutes bacterium]|jgi:ABC-type transport system involved in multi-copper enzyme maturation permease subunit|nr:hypothetical protein [Bacillota bacterium]HBK59678.1 hypothetical protein [Bacillota bacterium]